MIYFAQDTATTHIKVGSSDDVDRRISELQTGSPSKIRLLAVVDGDRTYETHLHKLLSAAHVRGEWFQGRAVIRFLSNLPAGKFERIHPILSSIPAEYAFPAGKRTADGRKRRWTAAERRAAKAMREGSNQIFDKT